MGAARARLVLKNPCKPDLQPVEVEALADSGANYLCIPRHLQLQLELDQIDRRQVTLANGGATSVPYVGPIELRFKNRLGFVGALVLGDEVLLGTIPMDDMDLVILPKTRSVDVNPANPIYAMGLAKGVRA